MKNLWKILACAGGLWACGSQTDSDYRGDVQGMVKGTIVLDQGLRVQEPMDVFLTWMSSDTEEDDGEADENVHYQTSRTRIEGKFPAAYEFTLVEPPDHGVQLLGGQYTATEGLLLPDEVGIGFANISAAPSAWLDEVEARGGSIYKQEEGPAIYGGSQDYAIVYVSADVKPGTLSEYTLGGALERGFHLVRVIDDKGEEESGSPACQDVADSGCWDKTFGALSDEEWSALDDRDLIPIRADQHRCEYDYARKTGCFDGAADHKWRFEPAAQGFETPVEINIVDGESDFQFPLNS